MARHENRIAPQNDAEANGDEIDEEDHQFRRVTISDKNDKPQLVDLSFLKFITQFIDTINYDCIKTFVRWLLDNAELNISISIDDIMMAMTLFVLFGNNIAYMSAPRSVDGAFSIVNSICLFFFIAEFLANSWSKTTIFTFYPLSFEGYLCSFFWFCDLAAIVSMLPDISWISGPLGMGAASTSVSGNSSYSKAGRVVRLVRLVRLVKLYKIASERRKRQAQEEELLELVRIGAIPYDEVEKRRALYNERQSRLGIQLSESITRKVIIIILVMLIVLPTLTYNASNSSTTYATNSLHHINIDQSVSFQAKEAMVKEFLDTFHVNEAMLGTPITRTKYIVYLSLSPWTNLSTSSPTPTFTDTPYVFLNNQGLISSIRSAAVEEHYLSTEVSGVTYSTKVIFSNNDLLRLASCYSIIMTLFVGIMLIMGSVIFTNDAQRLVIDPIERMMNMVEAVAQDPLSQLSFDHSSAGGTSSGEYETRLLESTIEKITGLLRVGFGEAGAGIISANLSDGNNSASINPLLPGMRVYCVVGFCDIHHFEDVLEKLSNDVLVFVNTIAEIVHSRVHRWGGQCNKNLGNAFVIIWRIGDEETLLAQMHGSTTKKYDQLPPTASSTGASNVNGVNPTNGSPSGKQLNNSSHTPKGPLRASAGFGPGEVRERVGLDEEPHKKKHVIDLRRVPGIDQIADRALIGYLKIIAEINRSQEILQYRSEPRLTNQGKDEFKVRMGFGLHAGWAIEGAVGSLQKVDATYLSPHVNMAARLETSSRQYGVPLLCSHPFYELMSVEGQDSCRKLDVVTVKGSEVPIGIYTYDCLQDQVFAKDDYYLPKSRRRASMEESDSEANNLSHSQQLQQQLASPANPNHHHHNNNNSNNNSNNSSGNIIPRVTMITMAVNSPVAPTYQTTSSSTTSASSERSSNATAISTMTQNLQRSTISSENDGPPPIFMGPDEDPADIFTDDYDLNTLRTHITDDFLETFKEGVDFYLSGDWPRAKEILILANEMMKSAAPALGGDGPSQTLIRYITEYNNKAPSTWKGYRPLTSK